MSPQPCGGLIKEVNKVQEWVETLEEGEWEEHLLLALSSLLWQSKQKPKIFIYMRLPLL